LSITRRKLNFIRVRHILPFARKDWKKRGIAKRMRLEFLKLPGYWIRYRVDPF
jgi:hypothetical protein